MSPTEIYLVAAIEALLAISLTIADRILTEWRTTMSNREQAAQRAADSVQPFATEIRNGGLGTNGPATVEAREAFAAAAALGVTHSEIRDAANR